MEQPIMKMADQHSPHQYPYRFFPATASTQASDWLLWQDLLIHKALFDKGIVVIKEKEFMEFEETLEDELILSWRKSIIEQGSILTCQNQPIITATDFSFKNHNLSLRNFFEQPNSIHDAALQTVPDKASAQKVYDLLKRLNNIPTRQINSGSNSVIIANVDNKEEVFFPVELAETAFYLYPWLTNNEPKFLSTEPFLGFEQFVTMGGLFGPELRGSDENGYKIPLIKHDIKFSGEQKIHYIHFNKHSFSPYEQILFKGHEKIAMMINRYAASPQHKHLFYHLPSYDYVLLGLELFIRGRMTFGALDKFIRIIFMQKQKHIAIIQSIFEKHQIKVIFDSPFAPIFGHLNQQSLFTAIQFLKTLGLLNNGLEYNFNSNEVNQKQEKELVANCLARLVDNQQNPYFAQIWQDFIETRGVEQISNLEELFKLANAVMLAIAAQGKSSNTTCSILPVTEKQIQTDYSFYVKNDKNNRYPSIVNFTTLDPLLIYNVHTKGLPFYFDSNHGNLSHLILEKNILEYAQQNIKALIKQQTITSVSSEVVKPLAIFDVLAEINTSPRP